MLTFQVKGEDFCWDYPSSKLVRNKKHAFVDMRKIRPQAIKCHEHIHYSLWKLINTCLPLFLFFVRNLHLLSLYLFKKFRNDTVAMLNILHLSCNPLSEVSIIGFSSLYFKATDNIILSGDRLSKSSGNKVVSANS